MKDFIIQDISGIGYEMRATVGFPALEPALGEKVDTYCPIDGTQLVLFSRESIGDFDACFCTACGAKYSGRGDDPVSLLKQARNYARGLERQVESKREALAKLEKVVQAARQNQVL